MEYTMKKLKLLSFPNNDINYERLKSVLNALECPEDEFDTLDAVLVSLINFFDGMEGIDAILIGHDLIKIRGAIASFYENID